MSRDTPATLKILHRLIAVAEEWVDGLLYRFHRFFGTQVPRQIVAYQGYADGEYLYIHGRVLATKARGGPLDDDGWWDNLMNTYRRLNSHEIPGVEVRISYQSQFLTVITDEEGYYQARIAAGDNIDEESLEWLRVSAAAGDVHAEHAVLAVPKGADYAVVSDMDDTVIHTGVTSILLTVKLTFLENAKTRKPLEGIAALYQALQKGCARVLRNPIFYVSSSPWNLYDLLIDFLSLNDIPAGPLLLRDLGVDRMKFIQEKGHGHKQEKTLRLMDQFPHLPFILIGDSGQEDPSIYAEITQLRPGRVKAIYIRDVDPDSDSVLDSAVCRAMETASSAGVPMVLAKDSDEISRHAQSLGLISHAGLSAIHEEVTADKERPHTGEQALQDAVQSILPE
jgi:phosphatidate phosphatase APP1